MKEKRFLISFRSDLKTKDEIDSIMSSMGLENSSDAIRHAINLTARCLPEAGKERSGDQGKEASNAEK